MGLIFKNIIYGNIRVDSNKIIGVMGNNYLKFIYSISGNESFFISKDDDFYTNNVNTEISLYIKNKSDSMKIKKIVLNEFNLGIDFLNKKIDFLSSGEKHLLKYLIAFVSNKKIIVIDEPFLYMDYNLKQKMKYLLKRIVYDTNKTIIIGSNDSNIINDLCQDVLLLGKSFYYGNTNDIFQNRDLLNEYSIDVPDIIEFVDLLKEKNILIDYSKDIRDLIKDVYKCV